MSTEKQIAANQANARKSTGPKSSAGKKRSSRNSLKHGLLSHHLVLDWEEQEQFDKLLGALSSEHQPVGPTEVLFVEQMAIAVWKMRRVHLIEGAMMERQVSATAKGLNHAEKTTEEKLRYGLALALHKNMQVVLNYHSLLDKSFYRALISLQKRQEQRSLIDHRATGEQPD